jgi:hypothetical protein
MYGAFDIQVFKNSPVSCIIFKVFYFPTFPIYFAGGFSQTNANHLSVHSISSQPLGWSAEKIMHISESVGRFGSPNAQSWKTISSPVERHKRLPSASLAPEDHKFISKSKKNCDCDFFKFPSI